MTAKLLALSGPLRPSEFDLGIGTTIGRDASSNIRSDDGAVAPHHCKFTSRDGHWILSDLGSRSGTFVNGIPIKERELQSGDEITIGSSTFLYEAGRSDGAASNPIKMDEEEALNVEVLELRPDEILNLPVESLAALPPSARMARNFSALLQISRAIGSLRDEESLPWQLLGMILDIIPAARGAIILTEGDSHEIRSQAAWDRLSGPDHPVHVNWIVVRRVINERVSLLGRPAETFREPSQSEHDQGNLPQSFLCVPMASQERTIGLIYLESASPATVFSEEYFQLLTAVSALAAIAIENARRFDRLGNENRRLRAEASLTHDMVGSSAHMRAVYQFIERVAPTDSTVLIYGESGTGKELAARAIYKNSPRKNQPFVALNCAALTETLLESELFGHEKGAFTSAFSQKKGFLEAAEGGTIFLDEIGELSPTLQAKLLRVLQEREFVRVGGTRTIKINVRFIAATNRDLQKAVREERFRADLYHRLNVISIVLPSLREHPEDIPVLAEYFCARHAKNCNRPLAGISAEALACLSRYDWPGNTRELENAMERAVVVGSTDMILAEDLPETVLDSAKEGATLPAKYHDALRSLKKQLILASVDQVDGNITEAAKLLGVHANYLHRLMRNLELRPAMRKRKSV